VYPQFILYAAGLARVDCNITRLGRNVNDSMPAYCVGEAAKLLDDAGGAGSGLSGRTVAVLGLAFRGGVTDTRLSPTFAVVDELKKLGARVRVHDPLVSNSAGLPQDVVFTNDLQEAVGGADLVILATDHPHYAALSQRELGDVPVYDGRGMLDSAGFAAGRFASIGRYNRQ
jgi:hypothetical protein